MSAVSLSNPNSIHKMDQQKEHPVAEISSDEEMAPTEESLSYKYIYGDIEFPSENLNSLKDGHYLSDSIVQFYLAYLINGCDKHLAERVHIFDSYLMNRLKPIFKQEINPVKLRNLNRWLTDVDVFKKDYIIFPICSEQHWFVIIVCYPKLVEEFEQSHYSRLDYENKDLDENTSGIIVMCSLACKAKKYTAIIRDFLDYEWRTRVEDIKRFSEYDLVAYHPRLPMQTNSYDCGIYMLAYVRAFLEDPDNFYECVKTKNALSEEKLANKIRKSLEMVNRDSIKALIRQICESNIR